jgi:hypothetical protein
LSGLIQAFGVFLQEDMTLVLLLISIGIFGYLALKSRNIRSFQFQISIFILIWIASELTNVLLETGLISLPSSFQEIGYELHVVSMVFFAIFIYGRYLYAYRRGREILDRDVPLPSPS